MPREKAIKDPQTLWEYFEEYQKWCKDNPRKKHVFVGKDGNSEFELLERPLTHEGYLGFCWEIKGHDINKYYYNVDGVYDEYVSICTRIKERIRRDQIEGGMVGQYNASITQRLNGLADKQEIEDKREPPVFEVKVKK
jgi:hypothetical protein